MVEEKKSKDSPYSQDEWIYVSNKPITDIEDPSVQCRVFQEMLADGVKCIHTGQERAHFSGGYCYYDAWKYHAKVSKEEAQRQTRMFREPQILPCEMCMGRLNKVENVLSGLGQQELSLAKWRREVEESLVSLQEAIKELEKKDIL